MTLDEKENIINERDETISSLKVSRRRESVESDDLRGVLEAKNREIESLNKKVRFYFRRFLVVCPKNGRLCLR